VTVDLDKLTKNYEEDTSLNLYNWKFQVWHIALRQKTGIYITTYIIIIAINSIFGIWKKVD